MSVSADIRSNPDGESLYRVQTVRLSSSLSFKTPIKAIDSGLLNVTQTVNPNSRKIKESFRRFSLDQIDDCLSDVTAEAKVDGWLNSQKNKFVANEVKVTFFEVDSASLPNTEQTEFLIEKMYTSSDISTLPILPSYNARRVEDTEFNGYMGFVKNCVDEINVINHKPIMGVLPHLSIRQTKQLLDWYLGAGVNCFAIDCDGSGPVAVYPRVFKILRLLKKDHTILDKTWLYGYNVGNRINKLSAVVPARDILGFGLGLDTVGNRRKKIGFNPAMQTLPVERKLRLFLKRDYGYWTDLTVQQAKQLLPTDTGITPFFDSLKDKVRAQKLFNSEQLALESVNIGQNLLDAPDTAIQYLSTKKQVSPEDFNKIKTAKRKVDG